MDHAGRRAVLAAAFGQMRVDALLVSSLPNVRYLSGFSGSNGLLIVAADGAVLLTDGRYVLQAGTEAPGVRVVQAPGDVPAAVAATADALGVGMLGFEPDDLTVQRHADLRALGVELAGVRGAIEALREVKDREELELIRLAQEVSDHAFAVVTGKLAEGMTEREVAFELEAAMRQGGADGVAFDTIVAFGPNGAEPHHHPGDRHLSRGELVTMDFGALVRGYHSDMTRTVAFGEPAGRAREVYELVRTAQQAGVDAVRAGATVEEVDHASRAVIEAAGLGDAFVHGLGHGVGLQIHERPWLRRDGTDLLRTGAVVTVEPGVYLAGELGVRIEDMVEVTTDGGAVLAASPKELVVL
jgi:Xaa-Pro aminopeptidase